MISPSTSKSSFPSSLLFISTNSPVPFDSKRSPRTVESYGSCMMLVIPPKETGYPTLTGRSNTYSANGIRSLISAPPPVKMKPALYSKR